MADLKNIRRIVDTVANIAANLNQGQIALVLSTDTANVLDSAGNVLGYAQFQYKDELANLHQVANINEKASFSNVAVGGAAATHDATVYIDSDSITEPAIIIDTIGGINNNPHMRLLGETTNAGAAEGDLWVDDDKLFYKPSGAKVELTLAGSGLSDVVDDLTPQLGGDLDLNNFDITDGATPLLRIYEGASNNLYFGLNAGSTDGVAFENVAIGTDALATIGGGVGGVRNVAVGFKAGELLDDGNDNVLIGNDAGASLTDDSSNVIIGSNADMGPGSISTVVIGPGAGAPTAFANVIMIGRNATVNDGNRAVMGSNDQRVDDLFIGRGDINVNAASETYRLSGTGGVGVNVTGSNIGVAGGRSTGNVVGGNVIFLTSAAGGSGSSLNALVERARITGSGLFGIGVTPTVQLHVKSTSTSLATVIIDTVGGANNNPHLRFVGESTNPGAVEGDLWVDGDILYYKPSGAKVDLTMGTGLNNIVEDITPQLGANLDLNTFFLVNGGVNHYRYSEADENLVLGNATFTITNGANNTIVGFAAGTNLGATASNNTIFGTDSLANVTGDDNTAIGWIVLRDLTSGDNNTAIGSRTGDNLVSGSNNIFIGVDSTAQTASSSSISIGNGANILADNQCVIGGPSTEIQDVYFGKGVSNATVVTGGVRIHPTGGTFANLGSDLILVGGSSVSGNGGNLIFETGDTTPSARMTINRVGLIGMGMVPATARLEIFVDTADAINGVHIINNDTSETIMVLEMDSSSANNTAVSFYNPNTTDNSDLIFAFNSDTTGGSAATNQMFARIGGTFTNHEHTTRDFRLIFSTWQAGSEVVVQTLKNGNTGFGTFPTDPAAKLDIKVGAAEGVDAIRINLDDTGQSAINIDSEATTEPAILIDIPDGDAHIRLTGDSGNATPTEGDLWRQSDGLFYYDGTQEINLLPNFSGDNVSDPPTDAQLDTAFGDPTTLPPGFVGILDDDNTGVDVWLVYTTGVAGEWYYLQGTQAV